MLMVRFMGMGEDEVENTKTIWGRIVKKYDDRKVRNDRVQGMTFSRFSGDKLPMLKARGAEVRVLTPVLAEVFAEMMDRGNTSHRNVKACFELLVSMDTILIDNRDSYTYTKTDAERFKKDSWQFCRTVTALIKHYHGINQNLFHFTIKSHYLLHLGLIAQHMSLTLGSCESGEEMMKVVKRIVSSCASGSSGEVVINKAMTKYVHGLAFDFGRMDHPLFGRLS